MRATTTHPPMPAATNTSSGPSARESSQTQVQAPHLHGCCPLGACHPSSPSPPIKGFGTRTEPLNNIEKGEAHRIPIVHTEPSLLSCLPDLDPSDVCLPNPLWRVPLLLGSQYTSDGPKWLCGHVMCMCNSAQPYAPRHRVDHTSHQLMDWAFLACDVPYGFSLCFLFIFI